MMPYVMKEKARYKVSMNDFMTLKPVTIQLYYAEFAAYALYAA